MLRHAAHRAHWFCLVPLCLLSAAAADDAAATKYTLRYRFAADSALHYTVGNDSTIDVQVGATSESVQHGSESGRVLRTVSLNPDGSAVLEVSIDYVNLSAGNGEISWDSRSGTEPPGEFKGIENTIGKPLMTVTVATSGTVTAAESNGKAVDKEHLAAAQFDLFPIFPDAAVAVGESWSEPFQVDVVTPSKLPKKVSLQRTYTLRAVDQGIAEIDVRTSVLTPIQDPLEEGQLIQRTPAGTLRIDLAQGRLLERVMKIDNKVVGFQGPQTALHVVGTRQESLGSEEKAAARPTGAVTQ
jgi:hypothetical protein